MRQETINIFLFSELSEEAKEKAHQNHVNKRHDYAWEQEYIESMKEFASRMPITLGNWSAGGRGEGVNFTIEDDLEELTGVRLMAYLYNNHFNDLFQGKYYSLWSKKDQNPHWTEKGHAPWGDLKVRHSRVMFVSRNCVLTGVASDEDILDPIYNFLEGKDWDWDTTFGKLIESCFDSWIKGFNGNREGQDTIEYFEQEADANEWEYLEDGSMV